MHRRRLILTGLALLPPAARPAPAAATPRPGSRLRRATRRPGASRLTAAAPRFKIVTRTFVSTLPITIPAGAPTTVEGAAAPYPSTIQVGGFNQGRILNVRVALLGLTHTSPNELDILLVAPGNVGVILLSDAVDDDNVSNITLVFDQAAPGTPLEPLTRGTFQPKNGGAASDPFPPPAPAGISGHSLTTFNNRNPNGAWRLFIVDDGPNDTGSLTGWSLTIRARVRVPHRHGRPAARRPARRAKR
jgi:subtilisin-like proprotein convertase family protein